MGRNRAAEPPSSLTEALRRFTLDEILRLDLYVGILGGVGAGLLAFYAPDKLDGVIVVAASLVGVVIGAVLAGVAIMSAFLDQAFLRKLKAIGREPVRYIEPFLFTAWLGIMSAFSLLVFVALPNATPQWLFIALAGLSGLLSTWTLGSVVWDLDMLVQFLGLQVDAADIPDDPSISSLRTRAKPEERGNPRSGEGN